MLKQPITSWKTPDKRFSLLIQCFQFAKIEMNFGVNSMETISINKDQRRFAIHNYLHFFSNWRKAIVTNRNEWRSQCEIKSMTLLRFLIDIGNRENFQCETWRTHFVCCWRKRGKKAHTKQNNKTRYDKYETWTIPAVRFVCNQLGDAKRDLRNTASSESKLQFERGEKNHLRCKIVW